MKVGDIVQWVGFQSFRVGGVYTRPSATTGVIIRIVDSGWSKSRVDVLWMDGVVGEFLYPDTIEVIEVANNGNG